MSQVSLYDLPSKGRCACWSLNPWKTRLALNFKGVDYKTEWVEYPDIASTLKPRVEPNKPSLNPVQYSIPTARFPDNTYIMDSKAIALRLEKDYPSPSMHLNSPILPEVEKVVPSINAALRGVWCPKVPPQLLNEPSREYFVRTREERFGIKFENMAETMGGEEAWMEALPGIKALGEILRKNGGPFVQGETVSYADFVIVGWLRFYKVIEEDLFKRVVDIEPALGKLYYASKQWLERDDH
ncbi:hypothetical protein NA56DRAFT_652562 [Hyaloscypha hepaticicola]|uniref:Uncharacterized protein n=1 Tax=Hyaloscypha hepaticicola TaxID=2082293 RepID=A0A2J6PE58_9HELO|nr:hypothetical protein NA56DRAFT_652562 [Hyaloscypha hepaticicola]